MNPLKIFASTLFADTKTEKPMNIESLYDIEINSLNGSSIRFEDFKGKHILIVNVASKCGFTSQYKDLQKLHEAYQDSIVVIGVPCNQFGAQEPGDAHEIQSFCELNYGVSFLITEKIDVKGKHQHPLYNWLTNKSINGSKDSSVKWNFQKYLINQDGELVDYFYSATNPMNSKITKHLK